MPPMSALSATVIILWALVAGLGVSGYEAVMLATDGAFDPTHLAAGIGSFGLGALAMWWRMSHE
jgi:hypothetical protein